MATDFSPQSARALERALELAATFGASVFVVHAYRAPRYGAELVGVNELERVMAESADRELQEIVGSCAGKGVHVQPVLRAGDPEELILDAAEQFGADLIVLGVHPHRRALSALLHGNVATRLIRSSRRPVLTVSDAASPVSH